MNWIINNQLGRRNLHPDQASYLRGKRYNAESGMDLKAYAEASGKVVTTLRYKAMAFRVASESHVRFVNVADSWRNLAEIHAARINPLPHLTKLFP